MNDDVQRLLGTAVGPMGLGMLMAGACLWAAGPTLGFFGGTLIWITCTAGWFATGDRRMDGLIRTAALADGAGLAWLLAIFAGMLGFWQWVQIYLLLAAVTLAAGGLTRLLARWLAKELVAGLVATALLALHAWPVWLTDVLRGPHGPTLTHWLIPLHPPIVLNSVLIHLGVWTEQPIVYGLTALNQDVPYSLPAVWPAVIFYGLAAVAGWICSPGPET